MDRGAVTSNCQALARQRKKEELSFAPVPIAGWVNLDSPMKFQLVRSHHIAESYIQVESSVVVGESHTKRGVKKEPN